MIWGEYYIEFMFHLYIEKNFESKGGRKREEEGMKRKTEEIEEMRIEERQDEEKRRGKRIKQVK